MSEALGQGPLDLYRSGEDALLSYADAFRAAYEHQSVIADQLKEARSATRAARHTMNSHGADLLESIHGSVTPGTDPGDYLAAILNTYHSGQHIGDEVASRLAPMRDQVRQKSIPIGIVGSNLHRLQFGMSAGDIKVRRRHDHETSFDTFSGIRLEVPLVRMSGYSGRVSSATDSQWRYNGDWDEPYDVGIKQWLSTLRVAETTDEIQAINAMDHRPFSKNDTVMHDERDVKNYTGFVPFIAYGETAVSGLLAALYEGRGIASFAKRPNPEDVLAAAISLDIPPDAITDTSTDELRTSLRGHFTRQVTSNVLSVIRGVASSRRHSGGGHGPNWMITASPQVMSFVGIEQDELTEAVRTGIEKAIDDLRVDNEADRPTWIGQENEYRLLEDEAREKAVGLIATRYGTVIDPSQLESEALNRKLAERLETKREEQARHEKFMREHPWAYARSGR